MKVVINTCYGGFGLSEKAYKYLGLAWDGYGYDFKGDGTRADSFLVKCVEELGEESFGQFAKLKIVEIPDDVEWQIEEYDGAEWVAEKHRTWE